MPMIIRNLGQWIYGRVAVARMSCEIEIESISYIKNDRNMCVLIRYSAWCRFLPAVVYELKVCLNFSSHRGSLSAWISLIVVYHPKSCWFITGIDSLYVLKSF